jgi:pimeloyl-ACP methyl ester carboxylesterase
MPSESQQPSKGIPVTRTLNRISLISVFMVLPFISTPSIHAQQTKQGRTANVNGVQLYYETYGEGSPLVLLHGFLASGKVWEPYVAHFAKYFRVVVVDMRGHGRSTNPTNQFTMRQSALDIFALLDQLGVKNFKAIGASAGAMTLIHMATQQPGRVEAMILISGTPYIPISGRKDLRPADSLKPQDYEWLRKYAAFGDDQIRSLADQLYNLRDNYEVMNFTPPYLSTIKAKTLIVHGDRDPLFPVEMALEMYRSIPNAYFWVLPNGDHGPIDKHPDVFKQWALEFLRGEWDNK